MDISAAYRQLLRRVQMALSIGRVTATSDSGPIQKLQVQTPLEVRGDTPRMSDFGFSSGLPVGTDVVIAFLGGDRSSGVIIASNHQSHRQSGLKPGETVIYSQWGQLVKLTETGITIDADGQPVDVVNSTVVTITASEEVLAKTPVLKCTGDIIDNCESNTATLKQLREAYNDHDHQVKNVQGGHRTIDSAKPSQPVGG
ncbi:MULTISPECIES: phage baseplate assembly protein domain-containing protein [Candidatus Williamhamiltonella]|uniref:Baseplate assembly protein n=1 Tax=Candidatus Williamhamiltonella defendens TaxID=138072 RepID=A0A2D3TBG2_9ENTR|nr:phage baseplate assembly protein [Candidatus Hamiltonella defensa]ATW33147.1 baseplate assembly protein [Candidatus Hamiltonella defensa]